MSKKIKILILDPFYTNFHNDLAEFLSDDIYAFIFNLGNILYTKNAKKIIVHHKIPKQKYNERDINIVKNTKTLFSETLRKIDNKEPKWEDIEYQAKYISYLREYLQNKDIDLVLMHNDLRWQHSLGIKVCKELNINYLVTERGLFRPNTTTVDFKGVNANSSIVKDKNFYKNMDIKDKKLDKYPVDKLISFKVNTKFAIFILLNKVGNIFKQNSIVHNRSYNLYLYIKMFVKQKLSIRSKQNEVLPKKYIFIPLQVNNDTQVLIHSDFKNMQEFITLVEQNFYALDPAIRNDLHLVFKIHPLEAGAINYKFHANSYVSNKYANELVKNSEFVITLNSTVGFEALQHFKRVIVLADAFYKIEDIVVLSNKKKFVSDLEETCKNNKPLDKELIKNFVKYLRYNYQINGNLFHYDEEVFKDIKNKLII